MKVDRHTKTKKSIFCNLEIFRIREKDFPVEVVELKGAFAKTVLKLNYLFTHLLRFQMPSPTSHGNPGVNGSPLSPAAIPTSATLDLVSPSRPTSASTSSCAARATSSCFVSV